MNSFLATFFVISTACMLASGYYLLASISNKLDEIHEDICTQHKQVRVSDLTAPSMKGRK